MVKDAYERLLDSYFDKPKRSTKSTKAMPSGGRVVWPFSGKKHSDEAKAKIREASLGKTQSEEAREKNRAHHPSCAVRCITDGREFASIKAAARAIGVNKARIQAVLKGRSGHVAGLVFERIGV